jgi:AcrR family transcriptional regulator
VGRWQPGSAGRLEEAALELFAERGYDGTTVADIAERAGLTKRTFFRYFTDKRDVLFAGSGAFQQTVLDAVRTAPADAAPLQAAAAGVLAAGHLLDEAREHAGGRAEIITAHPELQERELLKMAMLSEAVARTLRDRGVGEPIATLVSDSAIAAFKVAFSAWVTDTDGPSLPDRVDAALGQLRAVTGG